MIAELKTKIKCVPVLGSVARQIYRALKAPVRLLRLPCELEQWRDESRAAQRAMEDRVAQELASLRRDLEAKVANLLDQNHQRYIESADHKNQIAALSGQLLGLRNVAAANGHAPRSDGAGTPASGGVSPAFDDFYYNFEQRFRGSSEAIHQKLKSYSAYVEKLKALTTPERMVLDIGCGRGEFLQMLANEGIPARGIDLNQRMVDECRALNLQAECIDALAHLRALPSDSLAAVSAFQVVEHIPFEELMLILIELRRVVAKGGLVLLETPNPENVWVGSCTFYTDPTHLNPIPPETLSFMLSQAGFLRQDCVRPGSIPYEMTTSDPVLVDIVARFHASPDYAIVAFKDA